MGTEKQEPDCQKQFQAAVSVIQNLPKNGEAVGIGIWGSGWLLRLRPLNGSGPEPCNVYSQVPP